MHVFACEIVLQPSRQASKSSKHTIPRQVYQYLMHILLFLSDNSFSWISYRGRMAIEMPSFLNIVLKSYFL